ncbi:MAG: hypothetical protein ABIV50_06440 [Opitutus sp.]
MNFRTLLVISLLGAVPGFASESIPGLKQILSEAEWARAGLDRLSPDQIGVIDAALIRQHIQLFKQQQATISEVRATAAAAAAATVSAAPARQGLLERFGLPSFDDSDWRNAPPLRAKVVSWESANRFKLDNGQVWEGFDAITYELVGRDIEISARPHGQFALIVDGHNTTLRVMRLR